MLGAYPKGFSWTWDEGGDDVGRYESVWNVPTPKLDPVVGKKGGINKYWRTELMKAKF